MSEIAKVKDIMTKNVLAVSPDDALGLVAQLFEKYDYDGIPVIDKEHKLLGIITEYDMVAQSLGMHLPTVIAILDRISVNKADKKDLDEHFQTVRDIRAKQVMNSQPLLISPEAGLQEAARLFAEHHRVNPLCVADDKGMLVGVLSRYDVIRFFNEKYLHQMVSNVSPTPSPLEEAKSKSQKAVESAFGEVAKEFLLVTKKRRTWWRVLAVAAFIAGLIVATAMIIRLVREEDNLYFKEIREFSYQHLAV